MAELEDKYSRFQRATDIDLLAEIAAGGSEGGLDDYYTKEQSDVITNALDVRVTDLEDNPGGGTIPEELQDIADLTPSNNDLLQRKSGAWTNRTPAQVKTDLSLTKTDVSLGNVDNTSDLSKPISTATQTALNGKAASAHTHNATDVNAGTLDVARVPTGTSGTTVALGNHTHDSRYYTESEVDTLLASKANTADSLTASDTPRYLIFDGTWPARPADSRMTFYIGGDPLTNAPADSIEGDVWIPVSGG
jgi:maltoporin